MATQAQTQTQHQVDSVAKAVNELHNQFKELPNVAPNADIAAALTILLDFDKAIRKKRVAWLATLVQQASQRPLQGV